MQKSFTVNPNRTPDEIASYRILLEKGLYQGVEIFYPYKKTAQEKEAYFKSIKEYLTFNPTIVCHLPYGNDGNLATKVNLAQAISWIKEAIVFSAPLGVKRCTLHPGSCDHTLSRDAAIKLAAANIKEICQFAKKYDMTIMLENLIGEDELMRTPDEYFALKKLIGEDNVRMTFDVAHFHASAFCRQEDDIINFLEAARDEIWHLHISDNDGTRDMHAQLGVGCIDFKRYFQKLKEIGYHDNH